MRVSSFFSMFAGLLLASVSSASDHLYFGGTGSTGVSGRATFSFNYHLSILEVEIVNLASDPLADDGITGRITAFGFHTPFEMSAKATLLSLTGGTGLGYYPNATLNAGGLNFIASFVSSSSPNPSGGVSGGGSGGILSEETAVLKLQFAAEGDLETLYDHLSTEANVIAFRYQSILNSKTNSSSDAFFGSLLPPSHDGGSPFTSTGLVIGAVPEPATYGWIAVVFLLGLATIRRLRNRS